MGAAKKRGLVFVNATVETGYAALENSGVFVDEDGKIGEVFYMPRYKQKRFPSGAEVVDAAGCFVTPGLFDSHIHGIGGFGAEDCEPEAILGMSERLADYGVTDFLPAVFTDRLDRMEAAEKAILEAMGKEKGAVVRGINLEGPFISPKRIGAQNPEGVQAVDLAKFHRLIRAGQGKVVCMTVAPELKGMRNIALEAVKEGIVLLAGHTDATYENIMEGIQCGILHSTHFFNAMSRLHHRNPGCVGAIMIEEDMCCEIIADGIHVHPELVKLLVREKPTENIVMITDSLKPTGQTGGELLANGMKVALSRDGAWVSASDPSLFVGSATLLIKAMRNMVSWGVPLESVVQMASTNPARIYRLDRDIGALIPGKNANITVFDKDFNVKATVVDGNLVRNYF